MQISIICLVILATFTLSQGPVPTNTCGDRCTSCNWKPKALQQGTGTASMMKGDKVCNSCFGADLKDGKCVIGTLSTTNCGTVGKDNKCTKCKQGFYLFTDGDKLSCVAIPTTMTNCLAGHWNKTPATNLSQGVVTIVCDNCKSGFYVKANACVAVEKTTENCWLYKDANTCNVCNKEYEMNLADRTCTKKSTDDNGCWMKHEKTCTTCSMYLGYFSSDISQKVGAPAQTLTQICKKYSTTPSTNSKTLLSFCVIGLLALIAF